MRFGLMGTFTLSLAWATTCAAAEQPLPAAACPQLFGSQDSHEENTEFRDEHLDSVREADYTINLTHCSDWDAPERIRFKGLELVEILTGNGDDQVAVVRVDDSVGSVNCKPGLYRLREGDSIGKRGNVLAVLDEVVLLARGDELHYLKTPQAETPVFRMIWRAPWKITVLPSNSGRSVATKRASTRRTHRSTTPKRRRRRR